MTYASFLNFVKIHINIVWKIYVRCVLCTFWQACDGACCMLYLKLIKIRVSARWEMNASQHVLRNIYLSLYRSME